MRKDNKMEKELFLALDSGDVAIIKGLDMQVLLKVTFEGDTPLHIAAREGHLSIVEWILQAKPYLARVINKDGNTPLHEAAKCNNLDLFKYLLEHRKTSAYSYNKFGETALVVACKYGHVETVKLLCNAKKYNDTKEMQLCLRLAAYMGYSDIVTAILEKPTKSPLFTFDPPLMDLSVKYEDVGATPTLVAAVHGGHLETVKAALNSFSRHRSLMTEKDKFGMCAIHVAAIKGCSDIIEEFISRWPDSVEIRSSDHKTILHIAVEYDKFEVVQYLVRNLLLKKEAQKVAQLVSRDHDCSHNTAIHLAAKKGVDPQLGDYLISLEGVDVNAVNDDDHMTALDIASAGANDKYANCATIERQLESAGGIRLSYTAKYNGSISDSKKGGNKDIIKWEYKDIVNTHMIVASLIATVTFAAILTMPGGIEDDKKRVHYGAAKMAFRNLFRLFLFSNTAAFTTSFTLVVAWLVRQLIGDNYLERRSVLFHISTVTLIVSIIWTTASFVSATIIIILPANYEDLRSAHEEAFSDYRLLWRDYVVFAICAPLYFGTPLLFWVARIFGLGSKWSRNAVIFATYIVLILLTTFIIVFTFTYRYM